MSILTAFRGERDLIWKDKEASGCDWAAASQCQIKAPPGLTLDTLAISVFDRPRHDGITVHIVARLRQYPSYWWIWDHGRGRWAENAVVDKNGRFGFLRGIDQYVDRDGWPMQLHVEAPDILEFTYLPTEPMGGPLTIWDRLLEDWEP